MKKKAFIFIALLAGLGALAFGQGTQANSFFPIGGIAPDTSSAVPGIVLPGINLVASEALSGIPTPEGSFGPNTRSHLRSFHPLRFQTDNTGRPIPIKP